MNKLALVAILVTMIGWILMAITGINLLSGPFEDRTCLTGCVQTFFFSAVALGLVGLILSVLSLRQSQGRSLSIIALLLSLALWAVFATLFIAGNFL